MRQLVCCIVVALLAIVPAGASAALSSRADRVTAANAFAERTLSFESKRVSAEERSGAALQARRNAAQSCAAVFTSAPTNRHEDLSTMYFQYLSGALWSVDAPLYRSWFSDLRKSGRVDRFPTLARAADALKRQYSVANHFYKAFPDICATVIEWRAADWSEAGRRQALSGLRGALKDPPRRGDQSRLVSAAKQLRSYAREGKAAAKILEIGMDEPDARVHVHTGCDTVGRLLFIDEYAKECPPAP